MDNLYEILKFFHILSLVFLSIPLFNLIVVNERTLMGSGFVFAADRFMKKIIQRDAARCSLFQTNVYLRVFAAFGS